LDERAFLGVVFPRRGFLAGLELDHDVADPARFAGFHRQVLRDVVALVKQADGGDAVLHRGSQRIARLGHLRRVLRELLGHLGLDRLRRGRLVVARGQRGGGEHDRREGAHAQESGVQAS